VQRLDLADQDKRWLRVTGREKHLHKIMIAWDQHPAFAACPRQDHRVIGTCQPYLANMHCIVPGRFEMRRHPVRDVLVQQELHAVRAMGK
jgi:hypothetical protein